MAVFFFFFNLPVCHSAPPLSASAYTFGDSIGFSFIHGRRGFPSRDSPPLTFHSQLDTVRRLCVPEFCVLNCYQFGEDRRRRKEEGVVTELL